MAIKHSKPSRAPGPDGFTVLYYEKFAPILLLHLALYFNALYEGAPIDADSNKPLLALSPNLIKTQAM